MPIVENVGDMSSVARRRRRARWCGGAAGDVSRCVSRHVVFRRFGLLTFRRPSGATIQRVSTRRVCAAAALAQPLRERIEVRDEPERIAAIRLAHERAQRAAARERCVDVADDGAFDAVVDQLLHEMSGDAGVETKEVVVQPLGWQRDPRRAMLARGDDQQARGAASAASKRSTRTSPTTRTSCAIAHIFRFADEEVERRVTLAANDVRLIGEHAHVRVRQPPPHTLGILANLDDAITTDSTAGACARRGECRLPENARSRRDARRLAVERDDVMKPHAIAVAREKLHHAEVVQQRDCLR